MEICYYDPYRKLGHLIETWSLHQLGKTFPTEFFCSEFDHISPDSLFQTDRFLFSVIIFSLS